MKYVLFVLLLLVSAPALACKPAKPLSIEEAFKQADLVIVGQQLAPSPTKSKPDAKVDSKENMVPIQVFQTLKGDASGELIHAPSWYGMCKYGYFLDVSKRYVLFLKKEKNSWAKLGGSSDYEVKDGMADVDGAAIPVDTMSLTYGQ